jgi:hypothetical protein
MHADTSSSFAQKGQARGDWRWRFVGALDCCRWNCALSAPPTCLQARIRLLKASLLCSTAVAVRTGKSEREARVSALSQPQCIPAWRCTHPPAWKMATSVFTLALPTTAAFGPLARPSATRTSTRRVPLRSLSVRPKLSPHLPPHPRVLCQRV